MPYTWLVHFEESLIKRLGSLAFRYIANEDNKLQLNINAQNCLHCKVRLSLHLHVKFVKYLLYIVQLFSPLYLLFVSSLVNMK